jgi:hypothetical protein
MTPGRYTELFFLDEATALAAGHRPCGECRRADFLRFRAVWLTANPDRGLDANAPVGAIDRELHRDRLGADGRSRTYPAALDALPNGVFVAGTSSGNALLVWQGRLVPWSPAGYGAPRRGRRGERYAVLTPRSTVAAIAAGYVPGVHASLAARSSRKTAGPGRR